MKDLQTKLQEAAREGKVMPEAVKNVETWLACDELPAYVHASIGELVENGNWDELNNRFYRFIAFGTGGMRDHTISEIVTGPEKGTPDSYGAPEHPAVGTAVLNDINVARATIGLYRYCLEYLRNSGVYDYPKLVIAHDVRHFSRHFCELAASVWSRLGGSAMIFDGPRSTPQLSYSVRHLGATAGLVITASHNPPQDNGYKVYFSDGAQVVPPHDKGIIAEVNKVEIAEAARLLEKELDKVVALPATVDDAYLQALDDNVLDLDLLREHAPKIVFTPIHGTGGIMAPLALKRFGVECVQVEEQAKRDPRFPTVKSPNPENAEALSMGIELAKKVGAEAILATDPDCDRMGVAVRDKEGEMVLLTGNMIGSILAEYRISRMKEMGWLPAEGTKNAVLIKTFVTTPLQAAIAEANGLKVINTLTGFKWIGEKLKDYEDILRQKLLETDQIALDYDATPVAKKRELLLKHSTYYVFGGEESYGYLSSDKVRDKDGNAAVVMFCELAAYLKKQGKTFGEYLDEVYLKYGYHMESLLNIYYEGASGAARIKRILDTYRSNPPTTMGDTTVSSFKDFGVQDIEDADGKEIPKQDFYFLELANGYSYAVRGSGTEPKIKFYLFARESVSSQSELAGVKQKTEQTLNALKDAIEQDARQRAEGQ